MTAEQKQAIAILRRCSFYPGSRDKWFVRQMAANLDAENAHEENRTHLSDWNDRKLRDLVHRYRRQHDRCTCMECLRETMTRENPYQTTLFGELN